MKTHRSTQFVKVKKDLQTKKYNIFLNYNRTPLDMYYDYPMFIVSNQKKKSISIQRVKNKI